MPMHFFVIPALAPQPAQDEFNHFCATQRVVTIDRQFVADGKNSYWALCVTLAPGDGPLPDALKTPEHRAKTRSDGAASSRIDYKAVLNEQDFARYAELRIWRKSTAEREGVPVYAVFLVPTRRVGTQFGRAAPRVYPGNRYCKVKAIAYTARRAEDAFPRSALEREKPTASRQLSHAERGSDQKPARRRSD